MSLVSSTAWAQSAPSTATDDGVEVRFQGAESSWSLEGRELSEHCPHDCILHVPPGRYRVANGELRETVDLKHPSLFAVSRGWPEGRTAGAVTAILGLGVSVITGLVALGYCPRDSKTSSPFSVTTTNPCGDLSPTTRRTWFFVSATSFAVGVAGAFMYFLSSPSIAVKDLGPRPEPKGIPNVVLHVDGEGGGSIGGLVRF